MHQTADIPPETAAPKARRMFDRVFLATLAIGNLILLAVAMKDRSWGAFFVAIFCNPVFNGTMLLAGVLAIPSLRRRREHFLVGRHYALVVGLPITAVIADILIIASMDIGGC